MSNTGSTYFSSTSGRAEFDGVSAGRQRWVLRVTLYIVPLVVSYLVGLRDPRHAHEFVKDVAAWVDTRVQLTSDGLKLYVEAVEDAFGGERGLRHAGQNLRSRKPRRSAL